MAAAAATTVKEPGASGRQMREHTKEYEYNCMRACVKASASTCMRGFFVLYLYDSHTI